MRRTYRSKKDTGGALDPRDVLVNMDDKSSAFDAFYIQNIKQTKRELSCVALSNHVGVASNRVRKRKYVKRIVKQEPVRQKDNTMSSSAYLTPDKSIRVNKVLDPFDMLLNSSVNNHDVPKAPNDDNFEKIMSKRESKTYTRKIQRRKVKKFNYSSIDSNRTESDKENSTDLQSNVTDILKHELLVETEPRISPKNIDESLNRIVNNLSLLNNLKRRMSNTSFNTSYKCNRNRNKNFQSPILQKSPFCSTPFKEKYRGMSIFKFSPISQKELVRSSNYNVSLLEEKDKNDSIILVSKTSASKVLKQIAASPLTQSPNLSIKYMPVMLINDSGENSNNSKHNDDIAQNEIECANEPQKDMSNNEESYVQVTEVEPFLGFSNNNIEDITAIKDCLLKCIKENNSIQGENIDLYEKELVIDSSEIIDNDFDYAKDSVASNKDNISHSSVDSQNSDKESMYDTCNSDQSSVIDDFQNNKEPVVAIEKISDSVFLKYYEKFQMETQDEQMNDSTYNDENEYEEQKVKSQDEEISDQSENDDFESLASDQNLSDNSFSTETDPVETKSDVVVLSDSSTTEGCISNNEEIESDAEKANDNNDDEMYVSFVTTRRRNEITKDSMFIFDNSYGSSSTDCDKTVLSNVKEKSELNLSVDTPPKNYPVDEDSNKQDYRNTDIKLTDSSFDETISTVLTRKNSKESVIDSNDLACGEKFLNNSSDKRISNISSRLSKNSIIPIDNVALKDRSQNVSRMPTRKSSKLLRESGLPSTIMPSFTESRSTRKSSILSQHSNFSSPELDSGKNEISLVGENNTNNTVIETDILDVSQIDSKSKVKAPDSKATMNTTNSYKDNTSIGYLERSSYTGAESKQCIVLQPGKKWERSLSIYRRMTMGADHFDQSILEDECLQKKGRKYRQSVISTMEMQDRDSLHNDSINSPRSTFLSKPSRPTIRFVKDPNISISRVSLNTSSLFDDLKGFLNEECDDTVIELSKLSIADSEHEITILDNFHETERVTTARDYVLRRCNQTEPIHFDECYPETFLKNCHKIGEGVYGEVFLLRGRDGRARVMKIVPIAGTLKVNGEVQKDFHEIISEIVIAMELSALRAPIADIERQLNEGNDIHALELHAIENATDTFNEVLAVRCVYGAYPSRLLDLWELYDECKGSENDSPASLPSDQRYIVLELANAGQDLESYQFAGAQQAYALFQQIAFGLAVAEEAFQFEHRDLHWGNVLIAPTEQKYATFVLRGRVHRLPRCGVAATIIDYSLSRLTLPLAADSAALYNDLATDDQLFDAVGDYQFEVYRLMRDKLGNDWKNFEPYTNILWLHYTVDKMITALRYKRTNTKIHKHYIEKLKGIKNRILDYGSAVQYVLTDIEF